MMNDAVAQRLTARIEALEIQARSARDYVEFCNLQAIYGYYVDKTLYDQAADLFAADASRAFAVELLPHGIRVNVMMPGGIDTPIMARSVGAAAAENMKRGMAAHTPMGRIGVPREVAAAVLFLASAEALFINGTELVVDGGVVGCAA